MDEKTKAAMIEKVRKRILERWAELSLEERREARAAISQGMKRKHASRTVAERKAIAAKAAVSRRRNRGAKREQTEED